MSDIRAELIELAKTLPKYARVKDLIGLEVIEVEVQDGEPRDESRADWPYALDAST